MLRLMLMLNNNTGNNDDNNNYYDNCHSHVAADLNSNRYNSHSCFSPSLCFRPVLKAIEKEAGVVLRFPEVEKLNNPILQLDEVQFEYTPGNIIFTGVNLSAAMDSRICIVSIAGTLYVHIYSNSIMCVFMLLSLSSCSVQDLN